MFAFATYLHPRRSGPPPVSHRDSNRESLVRSELRALARGYYGHLYGAGSDFDQTVPHGDRDRLSPVCGAELAEGGLGVRIDCSFGDAKNLSDLPSRLARRDPDEHLSLARREMRSPIRRPT